MRGSSWMTRCFAFLCLIATIHARGYVASAINILENYGSLDLEFRVAPRNDTEHWMLHNENPFYVLGNYRTKITLYPESMQGILRLELCRGRTELFESFFRQFKVDGVDAPWALFSRGWSEWKHMITMGLDEQLSHERGYILVRVDMKSSDYVFTKTNLTCLTNETVKLFNETVINNAESVMKLHKKIGTHYVRSYALGNSFFQVLSYGVLDFEAVAKHLIRGRGRNLTYNDLKLFFSPAYTKSIGRIMSVNGFENATEWARKSFTQETSNIQIPSLLSLAWKPELLKTVVKYNFGAIVGLDLGLIHTVARPSPKLQWYKEITENLIRLNDGQV